VPLLPATDQSSRPLPKWSRWIRFEQVAPDKNRSREEYGIALSQNLLGEWVVSCSWGKIGGRKRAKEWYFSSKYEALVMAERIAHRRLARGYRVSAFE
jgi:predicted DNA-binding WGR domain protein